MRDSFFFFFAIWSGSRDSSPFSLLRLLNFIIMIIISYDFQGSASFALANLGGQLPKTLNLSHCSLQNTFLGYSRVREAISAFNNPVQHMCIHTPEAIPKFCESSKGCQRDLPHIIKLFVHFCAFIHT